MARTKKVKNNQKEFCSTEKFEDTNDIKEVVTNQTIKISKKNNVKQFKTVAYESECGLIVVQQEY